LKNDVGSYYYIEDTKVLKSIQVLGQLRIVGEDKYAESALKRGFLEKWISELLGCSEDDINDTCSDTIDSVVSRCDKMNIEVDEKF